MELNFKKFISEKEEAKLFKTISGMASKDSRIAQVDLVLFQLLNLTGLRISEALALTWDDIGEDYLVIRSEFSKNQKMGTVYLGKRALDLLSAFKQNNPYSHSKHIFNTQKGPYKRSNAHERLKFWLRVSGLRSDISLHSFRHTYATRALDAGISLSMVRDQLRHSSLSVTSLYLHFTQSNKDKLKEVF